LNTKYSGFSEKIIEHKILRLFGKNIEHKILRIFGKKILEHKILVFDFLHEA